MPERFLAEVASRYCAQAKKGGTMNTRYAEYASVVGIILLEDIDLDKVNQPPLAHYVIADKNTYIQYPAKAKMKWTVVKLTEELKEHDEKIYQWSHFLLTGKALPDAPNYVHQAMQMLAQKQWSDQEIEIQRRIEKAEAIGWGIRDAAEKEGRASGLAKGIKQGLKKGVKKGVKQGIKKGITKGIQKGIQKGVKQGIKKGVQKGIKKGVERGINQGAQDKAIEVAKNFLSMGLSLEQISKGTGLSIDKIKQL
jgi:flagellar biosynthesis/type III secretory pathway protein FliH